MRNTKDDTNNRIRQSARGNMHGKNPPFRSYKPLVHNIENLGNKVRGLECREFVDVIGTGAFARN